MFIVNFMSTWVAVYVVYFGWLDYRAELNPFERWKG